METTTLTTPAGHTVTFKTTLTYGDRRQLRRVWLSAAHVDPAHPDEPTYDPGAYIDAQELALKLLVTELRLADGAVHTEPTKIIATINAWSGDQERDGESIYAKVDELTKSHTITPDAKKN